MSSEHRIISAGEKQRDIFFQHSRKRLTQIAYRALQQGHNSQDMVLTFIDVDDPTWTTIVDALMPGHNWQEYRDRGEKPMARGSAYADGIIDVISELAPEVAAELNQEYPKDTFRTLVMGSRVVSVYLINPLESI